MPDSETDRRAVGHVAHVQGSVRAAADPLGLSPVVRAVASARTAPAFDEVYQAWFDYVWVTARRLGTPTDELDDVVQDVFLVVHRRLHDFEGRSSVKTWLYGITIRVVRDHRRRRARKPSGMPLEEQLADLTRPDPVRHAERSEARELLHAILQSMGDDQREIFVLADLQELTVPEIAEALDANVNTIYTRLRAARAVFEASLARHELREASPCR